LQLSAIDLGSEPAENSVELKTIVSPAVADSIVLRRLPVPESLRLVTVRVAPDASETALPTRPAPSRARRQWRRKESNEVETRARVGVAAPEGERFMAGGEYTGSMFYSAIRRERHKP